MQEKHGMAVACLPAEGGRMKDEGLKIKENIQFRIIIPLSFIIHLNSMEGVYVI